MQCDKMAQFGHADEPVVDVRAAEMIQDIECAEPALMTHAELAGMENSEDFYGKPGWDAGWLVDAYLRHDELQAGLDVAQLADLIERKTAAANEACDAKESDLDAHGYGRHDDDPALVVGLAPPSTTMTDDEIVAAIAHCPPREPAQAAGQEADLDAMIDRGIAAQDEAPEDDEAEDVDGGAACVCGHSIEEHGNDPEFPGSTACQYGGCR
jgi:hypothetical protein